MDEAAREGSTTVSEQEQRSPEEIREEIEETREELGDTAAELAAKTDVKAQAKAKVEDLKRSVRQKREEFGSRASEATPESVGAGVSQAASTAKENPVPLALAGAFAAGLVVGWILSR
jgi:ElaB/YqjD/DUF883 family membrane-anchored ribosome-binding protein